MAQQDTSPCNMGFWPVKKNQRKRRCTDLHTQMKVVSIILDSVWILICKKVWVAKFWTILVRVFKLDLVIFIFIFIIKIASFSKENFKVDSVAFELDLNRVNIFLCSI